MNAGENKHHRCGVRGVLCFGYYQPWAKTYRYRRANPAVGPLPREPFGRQHAAAQPFAIYADVSQEQECR